jgi:hypothetical protein
MKDYARISDGRVAEIFSTDKDISTLFNAALVWVDVTGKQVAVGWTWDGHSFAAPALPPPNLPSPTLADLQAQIAALSAQLASLVAEN